MFNNLLPISSTGFVQPQIQALPYDDSDDAPSFEHRQLQEEVTRLRAQEAQRVSNERAAAENAARRAERERERAQMRAELEAELRSKAAALKPSRPRHAQSTDSGRHRHFPTPVSRSGHAHFILSLTLIIFNQPAICILWLHMAPYGPYMAPYGAIHPGPKIYSSISPAMAISPASQALSRYM